jgi:hypothetical protein
VLALAALESLGRLDDVAQPARAAARRFDELEWREPLAHVFAETGAGGEEAWIWAARVRATFSHPGSSVGGGAAASPLAAWLDDPDVAWALGAHEHDGRRYVVKEPTERLLWWAALPALLDACATSVRDDAAIERIAAAVTRRAEALAKSGYRVDDLVAPVAEPSRRR